MHNGTTVVIEEISTQVRHEKVYNLTVANAHTYFVGEDGILVHNEDEWCDPVKAKKEAIEKVRHRLRLDDPDESNKARLKRITGHTRERVISAAYHLVTGDSEIGISGAAIPWNSLHEELQNFVARRQKKKEGFVYGKGTYGGCAEFKAANDLLNKTQKKWAKLVFIRWIRAKKIRTLKVKPACINCQAMATDAREALSGCYIQ